MQDERNKIQRSTNRVLEETIILARGDGIQQGVWEILVLFSSPSLAGPTTSDQADSGAVHTGRCRGVCPIAAIRKILPSSEKELVASRKKHSWTLDTDEETSPASSRFS